MPATPSDALVFFGATGDLAYKKIFPALQSMVRRGRLNTPVIGVAKAGWNLDQFKARARDSVEKHGGLDQAAFDKLLALLRYVDGDYNDPTTFQALRRELGSAAHPAHYLAIPPVLFGLVVEQLGKSGCANGARVIVEKPFGRDLESAQALNRILLQTSPSRRSSASTTTSARSRCRTCSFSASPTRFWSRSGTASTSTASRSRWPRTSACRAAASSTRRPGTIRDVVQNHLLQVLANLTMEPPVGTDSESVRDEKAKVLRAIPPLRPEDVVRGQFRGYKQEKGVAADSRSKRSSRCGWRSGRGAGRGCRSTSGRASACR